MYSDKYSVAFLVGFAMATVFWFFFMFMAGFCVYDHGKHVGRLESAAPELAAENEVESEK